MYVEGLTTEWHAKGFEKPESAAQDWTGHVYVSNMPGGPTGTGGYLSRLDEEGRFLKQRFIEGLDAPKGIEITPGHDLLVCDLSVVRIYDTLNGKKHLDLPIPGAKFLNGIAWDGADTFYVSDTETGLIMEFTGKDRNPSVFLEIEAPNGLVFDPKRKLLYVALWEDRAIAIVNERGEKQFIRSDRFENLDGIAILPNGSIAVSDWTRGNLYVVNREGEVSTIASGLKNPADINLSIEGTSLFVPEMGAGIVRSFIIQ